jgi:hypothetical protein
LHAGADIAPFEGDIGIMFEDADRLSYGAGLVPDLGFKFDGAVSEIVTLEWLTGCLSASGHQCQRGAKHRHANHGEHRPTSLVGSCHRPFPLPLTLPAMPNRALRCAPPKL